LTAWPGPRFRGSRAATLKRRIEPGAHALRLAVRDQAIVDAFMAIPAALKASTRISCILLGTAPRLSDRSPLRKIRGDLPIYLFSGSEDPVGSNCGTPHTDWPLRDAGLRDIGLRFFIGRRHEMLNEINDASPNPPAWLDFPDTGETERR